MDDGGLVWVSGREEVKVGRVDLLPEHAAHERGEEVSFLCLEDEFGLIDVTCFEDVYRESGYLAFSEPVVIVEGKLQKRRLGRSILASRVTRAPRALSRDEAVTSALKLPEPKIHSAAR